MLLFEGDKLKYSDLGISKKINALTEEEPLLLIGLAGTKIFASPEKMES